MENIVNHIKAVRFATKYAKRRGYEIIELKTNSEFDFICLDEDTLVFAVVAAGESSMPEILLDRAKMESAAVLWLASDEALEFADCTIRFDTIALQIFNDDRALVKHHINALS